MRKIVSMMMLISLAVATARAELSKGSQAVALFGGVGGSSDRYDFNGPEDKPVTGGGGAWGAQYVYYLKASPAIALGADLSKSSNGSLRTDELIANSDATARLKSTICMILARLSFPRGTWRPYIFAGVGIHDSSLLLSAKPHPGTTWVNGGTDSLVLIDDHKTSAALGYGVGLDLFFSERVFLGIEARETLLAGLRADTTANADALGLSLRHRHSVHQGNILFRLGWKFGA